jgi:O-methyltransferase
MGRFNRNPLSALLAKLHYVRLKHLSYRGDGLLATGQSVGFLREPRFQSAYRRGMFSGHWIGDGLNRDLHIEWRVHVACWAAAHGRLLQGDFVECGVNTGILSLAVCDYVDFNSIDKNFYLFDTYDGIPNDQMAASERADREASNLKYPDCFEVARQNFAPYQRARLIRGRVPESLYTTPIDRVSYLSIDMNIAYPERKAIEFFWPKLSSSSIVVLDDYGWDAYQEQKRTMDEFASSVGTEVLSLPTGQGILIKP